jgi:alpha-1,2-mannosyltransferase
MRREHWRVLLAVGVFASIINVRALFGIGVTQSDFAVYYGTAKALLCNHATNIYLMRSLHAGACVPNIPFQYMYPPLFAILFIPLALLPTTIAAVIWQVLSTAMLVLTLALLQDLWPLSHTRTFVALCIATVIAPPLLIGFSFGQIHTLVLCGLVLALWCQQRGYRFTVGVVIAVTSLIQVIPGLIVVYWLVRREGAYWQVPSLPSS